MHRFVPDFSLLIGNDPACALASDSREQLASSGLLWAARRFKVAWVLPAQSQNRRVPASMSSFGNRRETVAHCHLQRGLDNDAFPLMDRTRRPRR